MDFHNYGSLFNINIILIFPPMVLLDINWNKW